MPKFSNITTKPTDFNDLHVLEGLDQIKEQLTSGNTIIPESYKINAKGIHYLAFDKNNNLNAIWLASPIKIEAYFCDKDDKNHGILLSWKSAKTNKLHKWAMQSALLAGDGGEIFRKLLSEGVEINSNRKAKEKLLEYLNTVKANNKLTFINKIGWYENSFVLPDQIYPSNDNILFQSELSNSSTISVAGSLSDWQEYIGKYIKNNSRLILSVLCAFAAPLLKLMNEESSGINLVGNSSLGKTTALHMAASVWGNADNSFIKQWRTTCNALEIIAMNHRDSLLPLDELGQADSKSVGDMIYMLANNQGKGRLKSDLTLRETHQWRVLILSSGEVTLQTKIEESDKKVFAGMVVRFVSIRAYTDNSYGIFEDLHNFQNGETLSKYLKKMASTYYGSPIRAFLEQITINPSTIIEKIKKLQKNFSERYIPYGVSGQITRVGEKFGLIAAARKLAIEFKILPLNQDEAMLAIAKCFSSWLQEKGNTQDFEQEIALTKIKSFFEKYGESKFITIGENFSSKPLDRVGYKQKQGELCRGLNYKQVTKYLIGENYLLADNQGKNQIVKSLPGMGKVRVYHFSPKILS